MKQFCDLQIGDRVFIIDIFDYSVSIFELTGSCHILGDNMFDDIHRYFFYGNPVVGTIGSICIYNNTQSFDVNSHYMYFSDEKKFLEMLKQLTNA